MDTNLCMIKEESDDPDGKTLKESGRWFRDPTLPVHRNEITRFPHAVLEVKLSLQEGQQAPAWVQELLDSGYLTEVSGAEHVCAVDGNMVGTFAVY